MKTTPLIALVPLALGCVVAGCTKGSSDSTSSGVSAATSGALTGTTRNPAGYSWSPPQAVNQSPNGKVTALSVAASSTTTLAASSPSLDVVVLDTGSTESGFAFQPAGLVPIGSETYAASSDRNAPGAADVYIRTPTGWRQILDTPDQELALTSLGGDLVAASGQIGGGAPTIQVQAAGTTQWMPLTGLITTPCVPSAAASNGSELWVGAGPITLDGSAALFRGTTAQLDPVPLPVPTPSAGNRQEITAILSIPQGIAVAVGTFNASSGVPVDGVVLIHDGAGFQAVTSYAVDAPTALAWHDSTLYIGTDAGLLQYRTGDGRLIDEPNLPPNNGVHALLSLDAQTLLVGIQTPQGAAVLTRNPLTQGSGGSGGAGSGGGSGGNVPTDYLVDVKPLLQSCVGCHAALPTGFTLSAGLADDTADHAATVAQVNATTPEASPLLTKVDGTDMHQGGAPWAKGSAPYNTVIKWIADGTLLDKGPVAGNNSPAAPATPAPIAANPTYLVDIKPIMQTCVGCHQNEDPRLSAGLTDNTADYQSILDEVDLGNPADSGLLTRATKQRGHPVKVFDVGSRPYDTILKWIQDGAPFQ